MMNTSRDRAQMLNAGYNYPASQKLRNTASPRQDWLSSPTLSIPDWSTDNQPTDVYAASPISSPGVPTPSNGDSWNLFDESFKASMEATLSPLSSPTMDSFGNPVLLYPSNAPQTNWSSNWLPAEVDPEGIASSYLPLSVIYDPSTTCESEAGDDTETGMYSNEPSETFESPQSPRKAAWGNERPARRSTGSNSKPERSSTRNRRRDSSNSTRSENGSSQSKGHQLRSTKQGQRISYAESDIKSDPLKGARTSHNQVEKQYRTRLNGQFSTLLNALPSDVIGTEVAGFGQGDSGSERRVSKAEVLVLAKKHIEDLERTKKSLENDKRALMEDVQRLKGAWVRMGGDVMP